MRLVLLPWLVVAILGCAHDVHVRYPAPPEAPTGTLVLRLTQAASDVSVAVNGILVVDDARTDKIVIDAVPTGTNEIVIAANGGDKAMRAWVSSDHPTTIPLGIPAESSAGLLKSIFATVVSIAAYSLLN